MSAPGHSVLSGAFNGFLYSPVSDHPGQVPVTVLSALARHNVDPWDEAANLAHMPRARAIARLASLISAANSDLERQAETELIASRLIELLPRPSVLGIRHGGGIPLPQPDHYWKIVACIALGALFVVLWVFGT